MNITVRDPQSRGASPSTPPAARRKHVPPSASRGGMRSTAELSKPGARVVVQAAPARGQATLPFSLSFERPATMLPQRIYEISHDEMGSYEIFLVPIGPDGRGMVYEAFSPDESSRSTTDVAHWPQPSRPRLGVGGLRRRIRLLGRRDVEPSRGNSRRPSLT